MIYASNEIGEENVFIRGRKLTLQKIPGLQDLIQRWNNNEVISVSEMVDLLDSKLEQEAILFLIKLLFENGGIQLSD